MHRRRRALWLDALCKDHVAPFAKDVTAGLLEQDAKRQQRRLVHAGLVDVVDLCRRAAPTAPHAPVESSSVAVDRLEQVALGQDAVAAAVGEMPLICVVDVVLGVPRRGVLATEEHLVWPIICFAERVLGDGGRSAAAFAALA